jgi:Bacterial regulatory proteins, tetR family.
VGRDRFTTDMIAKRAECSIGTIYRYFADRVDILDELYPNRVEGLDPEGLIHGRR